MKIFLVLTILLLPIPAKETPNFVFIIADDCTHLDLGCYGGQAKTPHLDKLVTEGLQFTRCFQTSAMCSPTRHAIYTGLYPVKSGAYANHTFVYPDVKSVVHDLKPLGYRVALNGKRHINPPEAFPFEYHENEKKKEESVIDMQAVHALMADSAKTGTPFALFACSNEPHGPYNKGKEFREHYDPAKLKLRPNLVDTPATRLEYRNYLAEISFYDLEVGLILSALDEHGLAENTLVIVVSEQGSAFPGAKWTCYDKGLQSALIARWPGKIQPDTTTEAMVEYIDFLPTFVEAAGAQPRTNIDGKSFLPVLLGETNHHKEQVYGLQTSRGIYNGPPHYAIRSIRDERYKLILNLSHEQTFQNYVVNSLSFKEWQAKAATGDEHAAQQVKRHGTRPPVEFYDLKIAPLETSNLANSEEHAATISALRKKLEAWMASQGDQGLETEMQAYTRMLSGNSDFKYWLEKLQVKPSERYRQAKKTN